MTAEHATAPPKGTRPRNRRALILAAATELFHARGYDQVSMNDVASAVNVRPSALYRHFSGKPQMFTAALIEEMAPIRALLRELDQNDAGLTEIGDRIAAIALGRSRLGLLWQRDARGLPPTDYAGLRAEVVESVTMLAELVAKRRTALSRQDARLLALCTYSALCSVSYHSGELPTDHWEEVLRDIIGTILRTSPAAEPHDSGVPEPPGLLPVARRERILHAAITLFAERGYAAVSMEDIGTHAGITGASVYHHFDSKQDLLAAALARGAEWLRYDLYRAFAGVTDPAEALPGLLRSYVDFAVAHSSSIDLLVGELRHLDERQRGSTKQAQREYVGEWVHLMRSGQPRLSGAEARIRVHAVLTIVNDIARTPRLACQPSVLRTLNDMGGAILKPGAR